ncbi:MAG: phosphoglucosamine mutase, partial [Ignavibacteriales bacterium]|nr:phosphoglucosamine mutase [Ignavibacteriales bacterium]
MSLMVSISGIRGIVGESLTPEVIVKYASAYAEYCGRGTIVLGRDGRITGKSIGHLVSSTFLQMGCDVKAIGVCPTPTVALAVEKLKAAGGISITASHNPMEWNGLKFFAPTGLFLDADQNREFWKIAESSRRQYAPWNRQGQHVSIEPFVDAHIDAVLSLSFIKPQAIRKRKFKVVLDCVNAAGGVCVPKLLKKLSCRVVELNCVVSGVFAHTPEPVPENLPDLCKRVKKEKADLGIAVDPDVDRLVLINEKGEPFGEEYTIATVVKFVLGNLSKSKARASRVVVNLSTTRAIEDIAQQYGVEVLRTPVGEINVAKKMKEVDAVVGGEGSGGVILPKLHLSRDALVGIGIILQYLSDFGGTLSELKQTLPQYSITKGKVDVANIDASSALTRIQQMHASNGNITTSDGLKIDFPDSWVHLRKSNTE